MPKYKKTGSKLLYKHPRTTLVEDQILLPNGKRSTYLVYEDLPDSSVLMVIIDGKILLSKEYTYPLDEYLLQIPGGLIEQDEDPLVAAKRELLEETGFIANKIEYLGSVLQSHRRSTAKMHYYLVTEISHSASRKEEHEFIELEWFTPKQINDLISTNNFVHEGTLAGLSLVSYKYPNLF